MTGNCGLCQVAHWLVMIGALNWGLVGVGGFTGSDLNVVHMVLGAWPTLEWIVYILVGVSALVKVFQCCPCCKTK